VDIENGSRTMLERESRTKSDKNHFQFRKIIADNFDIT